MIPKRVNEVIFEAYQDAITWCKPTTTVHNLILGKVWVDQEGEVRCLCWQSQSCLSASQVILKNHRTNERCQMTWSPYSDVGDSFPVLIGTMTMDRRSINSTHAVFTPGYVYDASDVVQYTVHGTWDKGLVVTPGRLERDSLPNIDAALAVRRLLERHNESRFDLFAESSQHCAVAGSATGPAVVAHVWHAAVLDGPQRASGNDQSAEFMAALMTFVLALQPNVCPTDSRFRQDQRELEQGAMDRAATQKHKLEVGSIYIWVLLA